jgi:ABC-type uncharacterized transport system substrate-binding protein
MKDKRILLVMLICFGFASLSWAQTENAKANKSETKSETQQLNDNLKKLETVWILDSLYVGEIAMDKTETAVDYNNIDGIDKVVFTKLDLRYGKSCLFERKQLEISSGSYSISEDGQLLLACENVSYSYQYQLTNDLTLEGEFSGGVSIAGYLPRYRVFIQYKKQSDK